MTVAISTSADAVGSGWSFIGPCVVGSVTSWYGEKPVQCGGRLVACATSSAGLVTAIAQSEISQGYLGSNSPETATYPGHV